MRHTTLLLSTLRMISLATFLVGLTTSLVLAATVRAMAALVVIALVLVVVLHHHPLCHPLLRSSILSIHHGNTSSGVGTLLLGQCLLVLIPPPSGPGLRLLSVSLEFSVSPLRLMRRALLPLRLTSRPLFTPCR